MSHSNEHRWQIVTNIIGIIYFSAWSISFYPQAILNYRRKSASGLSQDFSVLNPLGFLCYSIYTLTLRYSPLIRLQYSSRHDGSTPQVSASDMAFAIHALVLSLFTLGQTYWYARGGSSKAEQHDGRTTAEYGSIPRGGVHKREATTKWTSFSFGGIAIASAVGLVLVLSHKLEWLDFIYFISYVKLYISIAKWLPQLILNAHHRSTSGFAIFVVLLDLIGSTFSFLELALSSVFIAHDPSAIWGNPGKLGLSALTVGFDGVFLVQRYWLYGDAEHGGDDAIDAERSGLDEAVDERRPLIGRESGSGS